MSEERLARMEEKLDLLVSGQMALQSDVTELKGDVSELKGDVSELKGDVSELKGDVSELKGDVSGLKGDVTELKGDVSGLKGDVTELKGDVTNLKTGQAGLQHAIVVLHERIDNLDRKMEVRHEEVLDRMKGLWESDDAVKIEMRQGFGDLKEHADQRFDLLERAVRHHSAVINREGSSR